MTVDVPYSIIRSTQRQLSPDLNQQLSETQQWQFLGLNGFDCKGNDKIVWTSLLLMFTSRIVNSLHLNSDYNIAFSFSSLFMLPLYSLSAESRSHACKGLYILCHKKLPRSLRPRTKLFWKVQLKQAVPKFSRKIQFHFCSPCITPSLTITWGLLHKTKIRD